MPTTINPSNWEIIETYEYISDKELEQKIDLAKKTFEIWKNTSFEERKELFLNLAKIMLEQQKELAKLDTIEMWMLYKNALWDVSKSASWTVYFAEHAEKWLADIEFEEWGLKAKRVFEPLGVVYTISPWNFPYNQVFRNAVPNILAWNVVLSKHASNVPQVARKIEELFLQAGFPKWVYQNLQISASKSEKIISDPRIKWVNITWWDKAWRIIWSLAWKYIKPSILELGGNDPFIVLDTENIDDVISLAIKWRMSSCGQKCNSSKRFIVLEKYYDEFVKKLTSAMENLKIWNPFDDVDVGPLAKEELLDELEQIVSESVKKGAKLLTWWKRLDKKWFYFPPTVLSDVKPWMKVFEEETFWPVAPVIKAKDVEEAILLANKSRFGLASCVITKDKEKFDYVASKLETWNVFWNKIPTSYPFLPYGWVKDSWYWKELWERGMKNFVNEKILVY